MSKTLPERSTGPGYYAGYDRGPVGNLRANLKRYRPGSFWVLKSDPKGERYTLRCKDENGFLRFVGDNPGAFLEEKFKKVS